MTPRDITKGYFVHTIPMIIIEILFPVYGHLHASFRWQESLRLNVSTTEHLTEITEAFVQLKVLFSGLYLGMVGKAI